MAAYPVRIRQNLWEHVKQASRRTRVFVAGNFSARGRACIAAAEASPLPSSPSPSSTLTGSIGHRRRTPPASAPRRASLARRRPARYPRPSLDPRPRPLRVREARSPRDQRPPFRVQGRRWAAGCRRAARRKPCRKRPRPRWRQSAGRRRGKRRATGQRTHLRRRARERRISGGRGSQVAKESWIVLGCSARPEYSTARRATARCDGWWWLGRRSSVVSYLV